MFCFANVIFLFIMPFLLVIFNIFYFFLPLFFYSLVIFKPYFDMILSIQINSHRTVLVIPIIVIFIYLFLYIALMYLEFNSIILNIINF